MLNLNTGRLTVALFGALSVMISGVSQSQVTATVDLSDSPILASGRGPASNLVLSLSVEFPTVGAAYRNATYDNTIRTLGYWDSDTCYTYVTPSLPVEITVGVPGVGAPAGFFRRSRAATTFQCGGAGEYSGNFMNWAAQSAIDTLRYALTGGDRIVDTTTQTILQRADIPTDFFRSGSYFPGKTISTNANLYTPFSGTLNISSCRYVIYIGTGTGGSCGNASAAGNTGDRAVLRAAVEVCDATEGPLRTDLCKLQASGYYKPTGLMQQYADTIRFSAFGYALDSGNNRYGGVLRAPMKYAGKNAYDAAFNKITNTAPEWNATTGVFVTNPLSATEGNSGVANYLNKFGRVTQAATALNTTLGSSAMYKGNDPVSELYYEALRYIQGQNISPQVLSSNGAFTAAMYDGFPIYTNWLTTAIPDPITSTCQATSIIQIADANTHNDKTIPGNTRTDGSGDSARSVLTGEPDAVFWTNKVGAFEVANPVTGTTLTASLGTTNTGSSAASYYIAGLAYWANTQAIRADKPNIRVKTYVIDVNENGNGTISTTQRNEQLYLAAKYGGFSDDLNDGSPFTGTNPTARWASGVDNDNKPLPKTFFLGSNPARVVSALRTAFASIARSTGTLAGGSVSGTRVSTSGTDSFVSRLDAQNDAGNVLSFKLTSSGSTITVANAPTWNAADQLTGNAAAGVATPSPTSRTIVTTQTDGTPISLAWANLDSTQQALFNKSPDSGLVDNLGQRRVSYLQGARVDEVSKGTAASPTPFRDRTSLIASIVNSAPIYVGGKPSAAVSGPGYEAFYRNMTRTPVVYVGTNNGFLHAFDATTGVEKFAFIPRALVNKLPGTTSPNFVRQPMLDAPPVIAEAQVAFSGAASDWRSILISGYGGGYQGIFALNVTDPSAFSASTTSVLWEFSDSDDPKMGNLTSSPKLLKFRTGTNTFKWFVVVPSGYNNNKNDTPTGVTPARYDSNNQSALFLLDLTKSASASWSLNTNYYRIDLPTSFQDSTKANALLSPGFELGTDGEVRTLYAGDIQGNLWKFDFSTATPPFSNTNVLAFGGASGKPLYSALDGSGNRQPITIEPVVGTGPARTNIVVFGTGKFIESSDTASANYAQQTMYGIWDDLSNTSASRASGRTQLALRSATNASSTTFGVTGAAFGYGTSTSTKKGWYFDLPGLSNGERQVTNMAVANSFIFFNTLASVTPSANACAAYGGRQCAINGATGLSTGNTCAASSDGFLPAPVLIEPDVETETNTTAQGYAVRTSTPLVLTLVGAPASSSASASTAGKPLVTSAPTSRQQVRRLNWREIVDYDKLKGKY